MPDGFKREALWTKPLSIPARSGHPLLLAEQASLDELQCRDLVLPTITQRVRQEIEHLLSLLGIDLLSVMPRLLMVSISIRPASCARLGRSRTTAWGITMLAEPSSAATKRNVGSVRRSGARGHPALARA